MSSTPLTKNFHLYSHTHYFGFPVMVHNGPLIEEYLEKGFKLFQTALAKYNRVVMFRFDLRFPLDYPYQISNQVISNFNSGLKKAIERNRAMHPNGALKHQTDVDYLWVKEYGRHSQRPHYHYALFLNKDAFFTLGSPNSHESLMGLIIRQWAHAIGWPVPHSIGLVHKAKNARYDQREVMVFDVNQLDYTEQVEAGFYRFSYLFKADTKVFSDGLNNIGMSQLPKTVY